jgi:transcriptional regulator with XRE-family HTH domain
MTPEQLKQARLNAGFSRRGLARLLEIPEQSLRRLESGQNISPAYAKRVADFFEITVLDLMPGLIEGPSEAAA